MTDERQARLTGSAPVLFVRDVHAAAEHYRNAMGFAIGSFWGEPPDSAILGRDGMHVMLKQVADAAHIVPRGEISPGLSDMYFWVDDADALYRDFAARGALIACPPSDMFYGCREFRTMDVDGHSIAFGQVIR
jgi:uncharacterized glyoxalase superfamily protein PhnB